MHHLNIRVRETPTKSFISTSNRLLQELRGLVGEELEISTESKGREHLLVERITALFVNVSYEVLRNITLRVGLNQDAEEVAAQLKQIADLSDSLPAPTFAYALGLSQRIDWAISHNTDRRDFIRPGVQSPNRIILADMNVDPRKLFTRGPMFIACHLAAKEGGDANKVAAQLGKVFLEPAFFRDPRDWLRFTPEAREKLARDACEWWQNEIVRPTQAFIREQNQHGVGGTGAEDSRESFARSLGITVDILDWLTERISGGANPK